MLLRRQTILQAKTSFKSIRKSWEEYRNNGTVLQLNQLVWRHCVVAYMCHNVCYSVFKKAARGNKFRKYTYQQYLKMLERITCTQRCLRVVPYSNIAERNTKDLLLHIFEYIQKNILYPMLSSCCSVFKCCWARNQRSIIAYIWISNLSSCCSVFKCCWARNQRSIIAYIWISTSVFVLFRIQMLLGAKPKSYYYIYLNIQLCLRVLPYSNVAGRETKDLLLHMFEYPTLSSCCSVFKCCWARNQRSIIAYIWISNSVFVLFRIQMLLGAKPKIYYYIYLNIQLCLRVLPYSNVAERETKDLLLHIFEYPTCLRVLSYSNGAGRETKDLLLHIFEYPPLSSCCSVFKCCWARNQRAIITYIWIYCSQRYLRVALYSNVAGRETKDLLLHIFEYPPLSSCSSVFKYCWARNQRSIITYIWISNSVFVFFRIQMLLGARPKITYVWISNAIFVLFCIQMLPGAKPEIYYCIYLNMFKRISCIQLYVRVVPYSNIVGRETKDLLTHIFEYPLLSSCCSVFKCCWARNQRSIITYVWICSKEYLVSDAGFVFIKCIFQFLTIGGRESK